MKAKEETVDSEVPARETKLRELILEKLAEEGPVKQTKVLNGWFPSYSFRERLHVMHTLEYEGLVKLDWDRCYRLWKK